MGILQKKKNDQSGKIIEHGNSSQCLAKKSHCDVTENIKKEERGNQNNGSWRISYCLAALGVVISIVCVWFQSYFNGTLKTDEQLVVSCVVTIHTQFSPLNPSAFASFIDSEESKASLHGVLSWKNASVSWSWLQCSLLAALLPPADISPTPGHVWRLLPDISTQDVMLSSKYTAPPPSGPVEELLHHLLSLFHPQPFLYSRYGPRGAVAMLRAKSSDCLDILFRLHAEYQLNLPPRRPLWFTPAAFIGRLVMNMTDMAVMHFSLGVPTDKPLNVDMEWLTGPNEDKDMEVTISHIPKMSLVTEKSEAANIIWQEEISHSDALITLQKELYRFNQVEYLNFTKAFLKGSGESKPLHTIVLWGVLNDQSC